MPDSDALTGFLLRAKRATYVAQGDAASVVPLLPDSRQLEYREGNLFYRDVYYNTWSGTVDEFSGAELSRRDGAIVYRLTYAGGALR